MQRIQSLLWIGQSHNLARAGISEAPELDITWLSSTEEAFALPANSYDGIVLDEKETGNLFPGMSPPPDFWTRELPYLSRRRFGLENVAIDIAFFVVVFVILRLYEYFYI